MKVLFLSRRFYPDVGGVEKHVLEISKIIIKQGHEVTVVTQSQGVKNKIEGINIIRIPKPSKNRSGKIFIWKWFWRNRDIIKQSDIIHAHDVYFWYWSTKFLFLSKKSYVTFHGYETYPIKKRAIFSRKISELLADGNIIVGDFIRKWYHTKPNFVIYGGVHIPSGFMTPKNKNSAVFIGRLDEHTGVLDYIKVVDLIREDYLDFDFKIIGDGKYIKRLKKYMPLGFRIDPIRFIQENNFAFVSRYLSILEALANKRLVFAFYDNSVKEDYLKMTPFANYIVIEDNPKKMARRVKFYMSQEKEARKLIENGYVWAKDQSWESVVKIYVKLWGFSHK